MSYVDLKELFKVIKGKKVEPVEVPTSDSVRYIQIDDLRNNDNLKYCVRDEKYIFANKEDIIIAWDGANAGTIGYGLEGVIGSTLAVLKTNSNQVFTPYIGRFLQSKFNYFRATCTGATIPHISRKALENLKLPIPSLERQILISNVLDKTQSLIDKRKAQIEALDQLTQSVFLEMFGDPIRNTKQWTVVEFGDICDTRLGKMLDKKKQRGQNSRPYLANRNVQWGYFILDDLPKMEFHDEELETFSLKKGDLLICEGGEVGRTAIWEYDNKNIYFQKALHRARIKNNRATPEYLQSVMHFFAVNGGFKDFTSKATIAHLTGVKLKRMPIPNPPINKQQEFTIITNVIRRKKSLLLNNLKELQNLFHSIMQRAFKGELFTEEKLPIA